MKCYFVKWHHNFDDEPTDFYTQVDSENNEIRKIEFLKNGKLVGFADANLEVGKSILSDQEIPNVEEINKDKQFEAVEISLKQFDSIWNKVYRSYLIHPNLDVAEKLYPTILHQLIAYEQFVDNFGDENNAEYENLEKSLENLTHKGMDNYHLYEAWEEEGVEILAFRIALPNPIKIDYLSKQELKDVFKNLYNLKIYTIPFEEQSFKQKFEIYLSDFYHDFLKLNFKNYNYQKLFGKQKSGNWLTKEEIIRKLMICI